MSANTISNDEQESIQTSSVDQKRIVIKSFKAKANAKRTAAEKFADLLTAYFGRVIFLSVNVVWFFTWIVINTGLVPGVEPFDPFPFGLLTMVVSLEAIFLAIVVLISQNREAKVAEIREEIELQLSTMSEGEITKLIKMLSMLLEKQGVNLENDPELKKMMKPFNSEKIEKQLEQELSK